MLDRPPSETEFLSWAYVVIWSGIIILTIPFAGEIADYLDESFGGLAIATALAILAAAALAAVLLLLIKRGKTSAAGYVWFAAATCMLMLSLTWFRSPYPAESFHYLEYGVLGVLLYRALSHRIRDYSIYAVAAMAGTMIGILDELVQWLTPGRYFELADIGLNFNGVLLAQVVLATSVRPTIISGWPDAAGLRRLSSLAAALLVLLALCVGILA